MTFKFERLDVWQNSLDYLTLIYRIADDLPEDERYNLRSQIIRAATSVNLNIAEGSTGQSDAEQVRFLGMALRSLLETVACLDLIERRRYLSSEQIAPVHERGHELFIKLQAFRKRIHPSRR
jgi:four helix bundle protein